MVKKEVQLRVGEIPSNAQSDIGIGIVRIDTKMMHDLGVKEGDVVQIEGKRKTGAIIIRAYPQDVGLNVIRMDGYTRRNAGTSIGERVIVRPIELKEAKKVIVAPAQKGIILQVSEDHIKRALMGRVITRGDIIVPVTRRRQRTNILGLEDLFDFGEFFGGGFGFGETRFVVVDTSPKETCKITDLTDFEVKSKAVEIKEEQLLASGITYEDIGGLHEEVKKVREMIELPLKHPELFKRLGIDPPKGVLLHGPPGTGKTLIAKAVANESGANFYSLAGPEVMSKFYGQSEENLRNIFKEAQENAPSIIFIDEIDALAPKRENVTGEVERRVVAQLLALMDGLQARGDNIVIAATNIPNALDPALRRPGRFDREIEINVPNRQGRKEVLQIHTRNMPLAKDVSLDKLSDITYGFVGADLTSLCREAAMSSLRRILPDINLKEEKIPAKVLESLQVTNQDFKNALLLVEPSAMREVLVEIPKVTWGDVGGLEEAKQNLIEMVEWPLKKPEAFKRLGIKPPKGVLLHGPPGTGKTLIGKAVANESNSNFIAISGSEVFSKWVGESEKRVRDVFKRAKQVAPSIVFIDELDAMAPKRGRGFDSGVTDRVVNQILTEMDGLTGLDGVVVIAATNRPDIIDPSLLRPGRFDRHIYIPLPDKESRKNIFKIYTKNMPLEKGFKIDKFVNKTENYVGADIEAICREAAICALRRDIKSKTVSEKDFLEALNKVRPTIEKKDIDIYKKRIGDTREIKTEEGIDYVG